MLWESLVTDGHVRAARLRRLQPWLIALGLILIWIGLWIARAGPQIGANTSFQQILQQRVMDARMHADNTLNSLPRLAMQTPEAKSLPPVRELEEVIETIRKSLNESNDLPEDDIDFKELDDEDFWKGDWGTERIVYMKDGNTYLVGANVNTGNENYPQPARWLGAFKQVKSAWEYTTLAANGTVHRIGARPAVPASQLVLFLESFLPDMPEKPDPAPAAQR